MTTVADYLKSLNKELNQIKAKQELLTCLLFEFPDLVRDEDRWKNEHFCSASINSKVTDVEFRHGCGCCNDTVLLASPFLVFKGINIYSHPTRIRIGNKDPYGEKYYKSNSTWRKKFKEHQIPDSITKRVLNYLGTSEEELLDLEKSKELEQQLEAQAYIVEDSPEESGNNQETP